MRLKLCKASFVFEVALNFFNTKLWKNERAREVGKGPFNAVEPLMGTWVCLQRVKQ